MKNLNFAIIALLLTISSCSNSGDKTISSYKTDKQVWLKTPLKVPDQSSTKVTSSKNKYQWTTPTTWVEEAGNSIRIGSFKFGASGDVSIVTLSGSGGGFVANINRWRGQLALNLATKKEIIQSVNNIKGKLGTFKVVFIKNNKTQNGMLTGVFQGQSRTLFVKAKGTIEELKLNEKEFIKLVRSIYVP